MSRKNSAFTLTELLAVMVIMGILMALLIPAVIGARKQAMIKLSKVRLKSIEGAITLYVQAFGAPPPPPYEHFYYVDASDNGWKVPAHYTESGTKVSYGEDVDDDDGQTVLKEDEWNIDINRDGTKDNESRTIESCLSGNSSDSWDKDTLLSDSEALYLFLTAKFRKFLPDSGRFGLQDDGTMILFATVNAGPFLTPAGARRKSNGPAPWWTNVWPPTRKACSRPSRKSKTPCSRKRNRRNTWRHCSGSSMPRAAHTSRPSSATEKA